MGNLNSDYHMAAVSSIRRAYYRSRKPLASAGPEFCLRPSDWLRQTHFLSVPEHCAGALYNPYGVIHDRRGFHLCGRGANPHQWPVDDCVSCNRCRSDPDPHSGNRSGLELLQAPAGNCRTVHRCWCSVLYLTSRLFYGRLQNHEYRVQILVQNGWFPTAAPCHERLVPSWFCLVHGTVHRKRWCADHR